jgi:hypothetical protein
MKIAVHWRIVRPFCPSMTQARSMGRLGIEMEAENFCWEGARPRVGVISKWQRFKRISGLTGHRRGI